MEFPTETIIDNFDEFGFALVGCIIFCIVMRAIWNVLVKIIKQKSEDKK